MASFSEILYVLYFKWPFCMGIVRFMENKSAKKLTDPLFQWAVQEKGYLDHPLDRNWLPSGKQTVCY